MKYLTCARQCIKEAVKQYSLEQELGVGGVESIELPEEWKGTRRMGLHYLTGFHKKCYMEKVTRLYTSKRQRHESCLYSPYTKLSSE